LAWRGVVWCASVLVVDASPEGVDLITGSQVGSFISDLASSVFLGRAREILPMEMQLALSSLLRHIACMFFLSCPMYACLIFLLLISFFKSC
jgi:hypothetical protein